MANQFQNLSYSYYSLLNPEDEEEVNPEEFRTGDNKNSLFPDLYTGSDLQIKHAQSVKNVPLMESPDFNQIEFQFRELDRKIFRTAKLYKIKLQEYNKQQANKQQFENIGGDTQTQKTNKNNNKCQLFPQSPIKHHDFIKNTKIVSQISQNINGYQIKHTLLQIDEICHGMVLPRAIKHIFCNPPAPLKLVCAAALIQESLGCVDEPILSQFNRDAMTHNFDTLKLPVNIIKYEDEVMIVNTTGEVHYVLRILYEGAYQRFKYTYERSLNEAEGQFKIQAFDYINESSNIIKQTIK